MVDARNQAIELLSIIIANSNRNTSSGRQQGGSEDPILQDLINRIASLIPARIDRARTIVTRDIRRPLGRGRSPIPIDYQVLSICDRRRRIRRVEGVLVGRDLVRERLEPGLMRIAFDVWTGVGVGGLRDAGFEDGPDVVGFAEVVPSHDLDKRREKMQYLEEKYVLIRSIGEGIRRLEVPLANDGSTCCLRAIHTPYRRPEDRYRTKATHLYTISFLALSLSSR